MKFGRHRFLIVALFMSLPIVTMFALVQTPYVSDLILNFSLRLVRFRTGIKIDAESWRVEPLAFSASLKKIKIEASGFAVSAPNVEVHVSPLYLVLGEVHLNTLVVDQADVRGVMPESPDDDFNLAEWLKKDVPTEAGRKIAAVVDRLTRRNVYLEKLKLNHARIAIDDIQIDDLSVELENLGAGQLHLDWDVKQLGKLDQIQPIKNFKGSFGLLKADADKFSLVLPNLEASLGGTHLNSVRANGSWPGESRVTLDIDLDELNAWLKASPGLGKKGQQVLAGKVKSDITVKIDARGPKSYRGTLKLEKFKFDEYFPNDVDLEFDGQGDKIRLSRLNVKLPVQIGDQKRWHHQVSSSSIVIDGKEIKGQLDLNEAGLCGILVAAGQLDCNTPLKVSGAVPFSGKLDPLEIVATPELSVAEGEVHTEPVHLKDPASLLVQLKPAKIAGKAVIVSKKLSLQNVRMTWGHDSFVQADGEIQFKPIVVGIDVNSSRADFQTLLTSFLDLEWRGVADLAARIDYNQLTPAAEGRTKVRGRLNMMNAGVEGQNFGNLIGSLNYARNELLIGPMRLLNGGGSATVNGRLSKRAKGSFLELGGNVQRLEIKAVSPESGSEIFNGFATGTIALSGYTAAKSSEFISGPFNLEVDNFRAFGVPFQRGKVRALYQDHKLKFTEVLADRHKHQVKMTGTLNPDGGSELLFSTPNFPIRELGVEPKLKIFSKGMVAVDGYWRPADGWKLLGRATDLRVAGRDLPNGNVELSGEENTFRFDLKIGDILAFRYDSLETPGSKIVSRDISADAHGVGLYVAFAYLKEWESPYPIQTTGRVRLKTEGDAGRFDFDNLRIVSTDIGTSGSREILSLPGKRVVSWGASGILKNDFDTNGSSDLALEGAPGARALSGQFNLDLRLLDLFVPKIKFQGGRLIGKARIPLPLRIDSIAAQAEVRNGSFFLDSLGHSVDGVKGNVEISRGNLNLRSVTGSMGAGDIALEGVYKLDPLKPVLSLQTTLNRAHLVLLDDVPLDASGSVMLRGEKPPYAMTGRVQVQNMIYAKEFDSAATLSELAAEPFLNFGLDVEIGNNVVVRNSLADMNLGGRMLIAGTDLAPSLQGRVLLQRGAVIANENRFEVTQGYVDFPGGATADPVLNLQAVTQVQAQNQIYKIDLRAQGPVKNLVIDFTSDPALANSDIISLLAFGVLNSEETQTNIATNDLIGAARVEALQRIFGKAIGSNIDRTTGFQVRLKAEQDIKQQEFVPKVTVERRLSDRVTATYGQSIDATKEQRDLKVDYRLLNNMNLSGVWEEKEDSESSVGVDLRFRFDIK